MLAGRSNMGDHLVTDVAPRFAKLGAQRSDIMVVNFAVWINRAAELEENVRMWAGFYQREKKRLPFVIWRDASVQHFDTPTGEGACCPNHGRTAELSQRADSLADTCAVHEQFHVQMHGEVHAHERRLAMRSWHVASVLAYESRSRRLPRAVAGDYKCDGCPEAQARPDDKGFRCKPVQGVALDAHNRLSTRDPAMQVRPAAGCGQACA